jgi:hypothetical protein
MELRKNWRRNEHYGCLRYAFRNWSGSHCREERREEPREERQQNWSKEYKDIRKEEQIKERQHERNKGILVVRIEAETI